MKVVEWQSVNDELMEILRKWLDKESMAIVGPLSMMHLDFSSLRAHFSLHLRSSFT